MGRPTTLTAAIQKEIVELVRQGNHLAPAARAAGVPDSTLRGWLAAPGEHFERFRDEIASAEAEAEAEAVGQVRVADQKWFLERRFPSRWGRQGESRAQAAAVVAIGGHSALRSEDDPDGHLTFSEDELRAASIVFLNRKRAARGEPLLLDEAEEQLRGLVEEATPDDAVDD